MKTISGGGKPATRPAGKKSPNPLQSQRTSALQRQRNGLLAIVHIAKQSLGMDDAAYRDVLEFYGVASSAALSISELEDLVDHFRGLGFQPLRKRGNGEAGKRRIAEALHARIWEEALALENGEKRLAGLVKKIAKVDDLRFCRNVGKLKQILRILKIFQEQEKEKRKRIKL